MIFSLSTSSIKIAIYHHFDLNKEINKLEWTRVQVQVTHIYISISIMSLCSSTIKCSKVRSINIPRDLQPNLANN